MLRPSLALTARAVWWRRGASATLLAVATATTAAAALGPLFASAASESTFTDRLSTTPASRTGLDFATTADVSQAPAMETVRHQVPAPGSLLGYPSATAAIRLPSAAKLLGVSGGTVATQVVWRDGQCAHLTFVSGRCASGPTDVMVSDRTVSGATAGSSEAGWWRTRSTRTSRGRAARFPDRSCSRLWGCTARRTRPTSSGAARTTSTPTCTAAATTAPTRSTRCSSIWPCSRSSRRPRPARSPWTSPSTLARSAWATPTGCARRSRTSAAASAPASPEAPSQPPSPRAGCSPARSWSSGEASLRTAHRRSPAWSWTS